MKEFSCGDVVPGCREDFAAESDEEVPTHVGEHARRDHGSTDVPKDLVDEVRRNIHTVAR